MDDGIHFILVAFVNRRDKAVRYAFELVGTDDATLDGLGFSRLHGKSLHLAVVPAADGLTHPDQSSARAYTLHDGVDLQALFVYLREDFTAQPFAVFLDIPFIVELRRAVIARLLPNRNASARASLT